GQQDPGAPPLQRGGCLLPGEEAEIMGVKRGRVFPSCRLLSREEEETSKIIAREDGHAAAPGLTCPSSKRGNATGRGMGSLKARASPDNPRRRCVMKIRFASCAFVL